MQQTIGRLFHVIIVAVGVCVAGCAGLAGIVLTYGAARSDGLSLVVGTLVFSAVVYGFHKIGSWVSVGSKGEGDENVQG